MRLDFDRKKSQKNADERGLPFELLANFEWETAAYYADNRKDYEEPRYVAFGYIEDRLYGVCFTPRQQGEVVRIISFRKANSREVKHYEKEIKTNPQ